MQPRAACRGGLNRSVVEIGPRTGDHQALRQRIRAGEYFSKGQRRQRIKALGMSYGRGPNNSRTTGRAAKALREYRKDSMIPPRSVYYALRQARGKTLIHPGKFRVLGRTSIWLTSDSVGGTPG